MLSITAQYAYINLFFFLLCIPHSYNKPISSHIHNTSTRNNLQGIGSLAQLSDIARSFPKNPSYLFSPQTPKFIPWWTVLTPLRISISIIIRISPCAKRQDYTYYSQHGSELPLDLPRQSCPGHFWHHRPGFDGLWFVPPCHASHLHQLSRINIL